MHFFMVVRRDVGPLEDQHNMRMFLAAAASLDAGILLPILAVDTTEHCGALA